MRRTERPTLAPDHNTEPGCYVDGTHGHHAMAQLLRTFSDDPAALALASAYDDDPSEARLDAVTAFCDALESELNDSLPDGTAAGWLDGEFYIFPHCGGLDTCTDADCGCWT